MTRHPLRPLALCTVLAAGTWLSACANLPEEAAAVPDVRPAEKAENPTVRDGTRHPPAVALRPPIDDDPERAVCRDADGDTCDDCASGTDDPANDGTDTDSDGLCDAGDADDDNDGVDDGSDPAPTNPDICGDSESDTCDDCSVGTDDLGPLSDADPFNDGVDAEIGRAHV